MKRVWIGTGLMLISLTAFAGKAERDFLSKELQPAAKATEAKYKEACGCALKVSLSDSLKSTDDMRKARYTLTSITDGAAKYCTDDGSKKAVCQMKTLELAKSAKSEFTFKGGKGTVTTDGQSSVTWDMITRELDK